MVILQMSDAENSDDLGCFDSHDISPSVIKQLLARGVTKLYPVQYKSLDEVLSGKDAIVQARTGTGKTFAFAIPIIEMLQKSKGVNLKAGRKPRVLVMAPTRELAQQISDDFQSLISENLSVIAVYGGVNYQKHADVITKGIDIVVGTPGRLKDLLENGCLILKRIKYVVLDEVDRMLDMGFREDVDTILAPIYEGEPGDMKKNSPQTLLFSATVPTWVEQFAKKYLDSDNRFSLNLVEDINRTATTVEHLAIQCPRNERPKIISDVVKIYSNTPESRCIIFCERKKMADELAVDSSMSNECHVMHGDIPQDKRELVLKKFRSGKYKILVTTNVAARGLDIPNVDLVVQCQPPKDVEDYIHRSGRTGRAGRPGKCICFYTTKEKDELQRVEREAGITFQRIAPPSTSDLVTTAHDQNLDVLREIPESTWEKYMESAKIVISELGNERSVACCLAKMAGHTSTLATRSIHTCRDGFTAYQMVVNRDEEVYAKGYCFKSLKHFIPEDIVETISHLVFTKGRKGFVFDLPSEHDDAVKEHWKDGKYDSLLKIDVLPDIEEEDSSRGGDRNSFGNGRGGGSFRGRWSDGGSRGRGRGGGNFRGRGGDDFRGRGSFRGRDGNSRGREGSFRGRGGNFRGTKRPFNDTNGSGASDSKRTVYNDSD